MEADIHAVFLKVGPKIVSSGNKNKVISDRHKTEVFSFICGMNSPKLKKKPASVKTNKLCNFFELWLRLNQYFFVFFSEIINLAV